MHVQRAGSGRKEAKATCFRLPAHVAVVGKFAEHGTGGTML